MAGCSVVDLEAVVEGISAFAFPESMHGRQ